MGEAFRHNSYRFAASQEAQMTRERQIYLGDESYKRLWPKAIWPGGLPGSVPLSVLFRNQVSWLPAAPRGESKFTFEPLMNEANLLAGGTLGDDISFFGALSIVESSADIELGHISFNDLLKNNLFNVRVGLIAPEVLFISNRRVLGPDYWITTLIVGDNNWSLEPNQKGFEAYGTKAQGRLLYNIGLVEGRGNRQNSQKDFYGHVAYKFDGLRYDGVGGTTTDKLWRDDSFQLGGFVYLGRATLGAIRQKDTFHMLGFDFLVSGSDVSFFGGFSWQRDDSPIIGLPDTSMTAANMLLELNYVIYPWLIPTFRFERFELEGVEDLRLTPTLQVLVRANLRAFMAIQLTDPHDDDFEARQIDWGLDVGF